MDSLFEDTEIEQLLELLNDQEEDEEGGGIKSFFREKILEEVKKKFEQLMEAEREAFLEEEDGQEEISKNGSYQRDFDT